MVELFRRLIVLGIASGIIIGNSDEIQNFVDEIVEYAAVVATSGDMKTISGMLDYYYLKKGRYPSEKKFLDWLNKNFKENNLKNNGDDHWNNPLIYKTENKNKTYRLISTGSDGIAGTKDDMEISGP